jgi:preprotein translocase subunit SecE
MTDTDAVSDREPRGRKDKGSVFSRLALFIRQVVAELRKVIWPTRKELIAYTTVVVIFVLIMAGIIAGYDYVFTRGVLLIFG